MADTTPPVIPTANAGTPSSSIPALSDTSIAMSPGADKLSADKTAAAELNKKSAALAPTPTPTPTGSPTPTATPDDTVLKANYYAGINNGGTMQQASDAATQGKIYTPPKTDTTEQPPAGTKWQYDQNTGTRSAVPITDTTVPPAGTSGAQPPAGSPEAAILAATLPDTSSQYYQDYAASAKKASDAAAGIFTTQDQADITAAGKAAGSQYDALISQSATKSEQSKASDLVAAAKSGGLDSSAWVGIASLLGVPAGVPDFKQVGGALESLASSYDAVVTNLEVQKTQAIAAAEEAKRQAIATGDMNAYKIANDAFDKVSQIAKDQITLNTNKSQVLQTYQDHLTKTTAEAQAAAQADVSTWATSGIDVSKISDQKKRDMELSLKLPYGTFDNYYSLQSSAAKMKTQTDQADYVAKTINFMKDIPAGQSVDIAMPDGTKAHYTSLANPADNIQVLKEDVNGKSVLMYVNKQTNQVVMQDLGISDATMKQAQTLVTQGFAKDTPTALQMLGVSGTGAPDSGPSSAAIDAATVKDASGNKINLSTYAVNDDGTTNLVAVRNVQTALDTIGKLNTPQDITNYLAKFPGTPITADMVVAASQKEGAPWEMILAQMQAETRMGIDGSKGATQNNFGNVGNTNTLMASGGSKPMATPQDGVNAVAHEMARRLVKPPTPEEQVTEWNLTDTSKPDPTTKNVIDSRTGKTPNDIWESAKTYALKGGSLQQFTGGLSNTGQSKNAKSAISGKAAALVDAAGVDMATLQMEFKANSGAINKQVGYLADVDRALGNAESGATKTQQLFKDKNINVFDATWANTTLNDLTKKFGDSSDIRAYQAAMTEIGNEYAQVFARGGQRSVEGNKIAQDLTNGNVKLADMQTTFDTLQAIGGTVVEGSLNEIKKVSTGGVGTDSVVKFLAEVHKTSTGGAGNNTSGNQGGSDNSGVSQNSGTTPSGFTYTIE